MPPSTIVARLQFKRGLTVNVATAAASGLDGEPLWSTNGKVQYVVQGGTAVVIGGISGVTAGNYGSSTLIPVLTVDSSGRITSASTATVTATGTVSSFSATGNNGVTTNVLTATTTPALTIGLGNITPTSVNASGTVAGSNLSGTNTGDQTITLTGDATGTGTGSFAVSVVRIQGYSISAVDNDPTLAANSSSRLATQQAIRNYISNLLDGLKWKVDVRAATTAAGTLASSFANGSVIDGVTLATGDRILIKNQASGSENGIYVVAASGAPTRSSDADTSAEMLQATCFSREGTVNADKGWTCTNDSITLGSTALVFGQSSGAGAYTAGAGLSLTGNQFAIDSSVVTLTGSQTLTNKVIGVGQLSGTIGVANGATGITTYALGDTLYASAANTLAKLAGNTTTAKQYLSQTGTGSVSAAPTWETIAAADVSGLGTAATASAASFQPIDTTLSALAGFNTNGLLVQTATDTFVGRSLANGTAININNPAGTAGNPIINFDPTGLTDLTTSSLSLLNDKLPINFGGSVRALVARSLAHYVDPAVNGFRLSATSGNPLPTTDVLAGTTLYLEVFTSNRICLYNGNHWREFTSSGTSLSITGLTVAKMYDVYVYDSSGSPALEVVAWTNDTTPATVISYVDGIAVKSTDNTRRYVGAFRTASGSSRLIDAFAGLSGRQVANYSNRVARGMSTTDSTSHNYNTNGGREWNGSPNLRIYFVVPQGCLGWVSDISVGTYLLNTSGPNSAAHGARFNSAGGNIVPLGLCAPSVAGVSSNRAGAGRHHPDVIGFNHYSYVQDGLGSPLTTTWQIGTITGTVWV